MLVMPANNSKWQVHYWAGKYGNLGHLYSIGSHRGPFPHLPYALDNGRFPAWSSGKEWDREAYIGLLQWARDAHIQPLWALVPDVVADAAATFREWEAWSAVVRGFLPNVPLAFAAQDGMRPDDVPPEAGVVFLGGSTEWKRQAIRPWCERHQRVHVGRINTYKWLVECHNAGAESCDGTGWFRGCTKQLAGLEQYLQEQQTNSVPLEAQEQISWE